VLQTPRRRHLLYTAVTHTPLTLDPRGRKEICRFLTLLLRIFCTGSESSNTTKPKLGSFPPLLILSSRTVPYSTHVQKRGIRSN
jgi:hypothetical protein